MKLQADIAEGVNTINAYTDTSVSVNGQVFHHSVLVPPTGDVIAWSVTAFEQLDESHFAHIAQCGPELVVFGTGTRLRFAPPRQLSPLMQARIGIETMDTAAACRTFNFLVAEGRQVMAALLIASPDAA